MNEITALNSIAEYINAKGIADSYESDEISQARLDKLAARAIEGFKTLVK
ncbi:hypothetical protein ACR9WD_06025 [Glutamicibacter sp. PAEs-4]